MARLARAVVPEIPHQRFETQALCYCLMGNHYHLLVNNIELILPTSGNHGVESCF